jgi:HAD superfamily hydrolase (TIGR01509 family)
VTRRRGGERVTRQCDGLIFDLDGTLVDTAALHVAATHHAALAVLGRDIDTATVRASLGRPLPESMDVVARGAGLSAAVDRARLVPALVATFLDHYTAHEVDLVRLFPGVPETLAELRRRGYPLALLSNKLREWGRAELQALGLAGYFAVAVFAEDMPRPKPAREALAPALEALGLPARRVLLVGDGAADIGCARAAGARAVAALWGAVVPEELLALRPDYALQGIADLLDLCPPR